MDVRTFDKSGRPPATLGDLIFDNQSNAHAIGAPDAPWLDYADLSALTSQVGQTLNKLGLGRNDRIAIVAPNGPLMACSFLTVGAFATTAPLNPAYRAAEFDFYLSDLNAKSLLIPEGFASPARDVAAAHGLPVIEMIPAVQGGGAFELRPPLGLEQAAAAPGPAQAEDVALVLHTSGTTARPKLVPLTHANILASAKHIGTTLTLSSADTCLNIMPLFHIHGLIAALLSTLRSGGAISCGSGLDGLRFFDWVRDVKPTWYTAVPSMHQTILKLAPRFQEVLAASRLRFIRSSSAALPPQVMTEMEATFGVPIIEAYGMTEAAHQMASNPLPPDSRRAGSVGRAAGPEIAIMDGAGKTLSPDQIGEVVIRGVNVTAGYEDNAAANASAFTDGWFRTGDQGRLDQQGYLWLTGRIKEQINRGGEKISPLEIDNLLMEHPAVQQAIVFAIPDKDYGETVGAAIVLREGAVTDAAAIRNFAKDRLAAFKVPAKIIFVDEIPKGATGKLQRIGLAEKLGLVRPSN
jgi:oxalate---CoA ligase